MARPLRVFMITSEWPTTEKPYQVPFIVQQVAFLRQAGVDVHLFHFRGAQSPARYVRAWLSARAAIAAEKFDLIHAQWGQSGLLALPKPAPMVVTFRGDDVEGIIGPNGQQTRKGRVLKTISRAIARTANQIIVVSDSLARAFPNRSYHVIPSGLNLDLFKPTDQAEARQALQLDLRRRYVLFAGAAGNPRKRYGLAKEAVELLRHDQQDRSGMDVELITAASVQHDQIPQYMNASDALLLVSLHEGSPNVVKEALACNLPVVATNVGDVCQRIGQLPGCAVLEDDSPQAIAAALRQVLLRGERINGRPSILDLDEKLLTQKVIDVYREALEGNSSSLSNLGGIGGKSYGIENKATYR